MAAVRVINMEEGLPTVDTAVKRMTFELHNARRNGEAALKIIHGYGSSGKGGRLRVELRRYLERQKGQKLVSAIIPGEKLSIFDADTRKLLEKCPDLRSDRDLDRFNSGVTYIML